MVENLLQFLTVLKCRQGQFRTQTRKKHDVRKRKPR